MVHSRQYEPLNLDDDDDDINDNAPRRAQSKSRRLIEPVVDAADAVWSKCVGFVRVNAGLLLVAASQAFFALMNVAVKKLNSLDPPVPALELVAVRMGITYICCLSYLLWKKVPDPFLGPKGVRHLLVVRGFSGFFGLFGVYYSLQYLSLSDATVLTFLVPLTTAVSGFFFLGEVFHRKEAAAGVLSLLGVVLIARPEAIFGSHSSKSAPGEIDWESSVTPEQRLGAVGVALVGVLGATGAYTSMRAIGKRAHTLHSMSYFSLWCVITSTVGMIVRHEQFIFPTRLEWLALLVMIGIFGFLAQALLTMGLQRETAGRGALAIYVQIIFATILERIFFHTVPSALSIVGTLIIMGSAVYVALTKQTTQVPPTASGENTSSEMVALDLELGVAEPETQTQRFVAYEQGNNNALRVFYQGQEGWKVGGVKSKSDVSLSLGLMERKGGEGLGEEVEEGVVLFDVGSGSGSDLNVDSESDEESESGNSEGGDNEERRRLIRS